MYVCAYLHLCPLSFDQNRYLGDAIDLKPHCVLAPYGLTWVECNVNLSCVSCSNHSRLEEHIEVRPLGRKTCDAEKKERETEVEFVAIQVCRVGKQSSLHGSTPKHPHIYIVRMQGFIRGQIFLGGGTYTSVYTYTCMYTSRRGDAQACVFNDIETHTHACSMHISFSFRIMTKMGQWQIMVMYISNEGQICMRNDSGLS